MSRMEKPAELWFVGGQPTQDIVIHRIYGDAVYLEAEDGYRYAVPRSAFFADIACYQHAPNTSAWHKSNRWYW